MNQIFIVKKEKLIKLVEEKKDNLLNKNKNYLHHIILFILIILVICLVIFLFFILRVKELNIKNELNELEQGYFSSNNNLNSREYSISYGKVNKGIKNNNYYVKKDNSIKSFATDGKCLIGIVKQINV